VSCNRTIHLWELLTWSYPITHHDIHLWWQTSPIELGLFWVHEPAHVFGLWVVWRQWSEAYISLIYGIYINSCELCREVGNRASVSSAGWPTQFHNRDTCIRIFSLSHKEHCHFVSQFLISVSFDVMCCLCWISIFMKVLGEEMWKLSRRDLLQLWVRGASLEYSGFVKLLSYHLEWWKIVSTGWARKCWHRKLIDNCNFIFNLIEIMHFHTPRC